MNDSRNTTTNVASLLAASVNVLLMLVVCFGVVPQVDRCIDETRKNRILLEESRELLRIDDDIIEERRRLIKRLNEYLDREDGKKK